MGNEMGNRNVSGLQEEDHTTVEAPEKSLQKAIDADDLKGENHIVPADEDKDYHEKVKELVSDDPSGAGDPHVDNQTSDGKEQVETEIQPSEGAPNVQVESNDVGADHSGIQTASSSKGASDHEKPMESNLDENLSQKNGSQIEKQTSIKRETATEEEEVQNSDFDTKSAPHNPDTLETVDPKFYQHELAKIHYDPSVEGHGGSSQGSEEMLGLKLVCDSEEKDHLLDTEIADNLAESGVSNANSDAETSRGDFLVKEMASQEEKMSDRSLCEEKFEVIDQDGVGNDMSQLTTKTSSFSSESGNKWDGEFPSEMNINRNDSLDSQAEATLLGNSLNFNEEVEVSETKDKCMVHTEETKLIESGFEVNGNDYNPIQFCDDSLEESQTDKVDATQSELMMTGFSRENEGNGSLVESSCNAGCKKDCQIEVARVAENGYKVDMCHDNTNLDSEEQCKDSEEGTQMVSENGEVPTELTVTDCNPEAEEPIEKQIIEEIEEKKEDAYALGNEDSGREVTEQCVPQSLPIEQAQGVLSPSPVSSVRPLDHEQDSVMESKTVEDSDILIADSKQESCSEFFVTKSSETDSTKSTVETAVSAVESENEKPQQDPSQYIEKTPTAVAETEVSANQSNELCAKDETSAFASVGRLSTESNPENQNIPVQFRKCPSFNFDLLIERRTEESDRTPLLYQDRTAAGSLSSRVGARTRSPVAETEYNLDPLQNQAMAVQEKGKLERSDSEKSRTPFLSLMKEEEEAHLVVTPQKNDSLGDGKKSPEELWNSSSTKEVASTSPKRKEKRKPRSSLFSNCMCCAAMIN